MENHLFHLYCLHAEQTNTDEGGKCIRAAEKIELENTILSAFPKVTNTVEWCSISSQGSPSSGPGWCSGKLMSSPLPQARCYLLPGYLPKNRRLSRPVVAAKKNNSEILSSASPTSHSWMLSIKSWLWFSVLARLRADATTPTHGHSPGNASNASLILRKSSWETARTSFCANLPPPEPYYRVCLAAVPGLGGGPPKLELEG